MQQIVGGGAVPPVLSQVVVGEGPGKATGAGDVRPPGTLHLDDLGPQVCQEAAGVWKGKDVGGIQDPDAF